ncbi:MAG: Fur family transcriptional regulator [Candidatus Parcubacteria bacterium]|nr:Fur family transcriptional regulator [Candidatus Parcubacteria bacterium]
MPTKDSKQILHSHGYKATPARLAILGVFSEGCNPMNAEQVYAKVKKTGLDLVTVYRTLTLFEKSRLLRKVDLQKDSVYFELNTDHHHHIICMKCEKVSEFENADDSKLIKAALKQAKDFKSISHHSFDLFGLCNSCAN